MKECSDLQGLNVNVNVQGGAREQTRRWYVGKGLRSEVLVHVIGFYGPA